MAYDTDNIFAKILRGEIPSVKVFEDDKTLAFMDVMPEADGHVLVVPKEDGAGYPGPVRRWPGRHDGDGAARGAAPWTRPGRPTAS